MAQSTSAASGSRAGGTGSTSPTGSSQATNMTTPISQRGSRTARGGPAAGTGSGRGRRRRSNPSSRPTVRSSKYFRLARIKRILRLHSRAHAISPVAALACATAVEFILEEILRLSKRVAALAKKGKISNRHIYLAIQSTDWLRELFDDSIIPGAGVASSLPARPPKVKRGKGPAPGKQQQSAVEGVTKSTPKQKSSVQQPAQSSVSSNSSAN